MIAHPIQASLPLQIGVTLVGIFASLSASLVTTIAYSYLRFRDLGATPRSKWCPKDDSLWMEFPVGYCFLAAMLYHNWNWLWVAGAILAIGAVSRRVTRRTVTHTSWKVHRAGAEVEERISKLTNAPANREVWIVSYASAAELLAAHKALGRMAALIPQGFAETAPMEEMVALSVRQVLVKASGRVRAVSAPVWCAIFPAMKMLDNQEPLGRLAYFAAALVLLADCRA